MAETQLIYFAKTDKLTNIKPIRNDVIPYVFNMENVPAFMFLPTLQSFLKNISTDKLYDIILLHWNMKNSFKEYYKNILEQYTNVRIRFVDNQDVYDTLSELNVYTIDSRMLLPWMLLDYKKAVVCNWNVFFRDSVEYIKDVLTDDKIIAGCKSILKIGMVNDVSDKYERYIQNELKILHKYELIDSNVVVMNLEKIRSTYSYKDILSKFDNIKEVLSFDEMLNLVIQEEKEFLNYEWNYYYTENLEENRIIKQAPKKLLEKYNESKINAKIVTYNPEFIWTLEPSEYNLKYWEYIKKSDFYHLFFGHMAAMIGNSMSSNTPIPKSMGRKLIGAIKCIQDHGFWYTIKYMYQRLRAM